ncbi:hypothetical protein [Mesorhizobium kowhaii]|jgi:hypothetical protein|uniref:Uncharacterized protein n=1 Tax=Mesorhizobium kowhaii TaxID=1300272 RepID=A0A2W7BYK4_9HYPH|nr:hypothetical protein [Mesorhizobium kowhaii]PZV34598.1 hypothetical protein B5V02_31255 [Mesorhizobium kowhaii]
MPVRSPHREQRAIHEIGYALIMIAEGMAELADLSTTSATDDLSDPNARPANNVAGYALISAPG